MGTLQMRRIIQAPRTRVYEALVDPARVARWRFPAGMTCVVHEFDAREGGRVHVSLTYEAADRVGKSEARTDTYRGRFVQLVPDELVVEADEFETDDPDFMGEMTMTIRLGDANGATELFATHEGVPRGVAPEDNEVGWDEALRRLAQLVEGE
jgi:uncharacterized protein YndB with AHSA1/START domain